MCFLVVTRTLCRRCRMRTEDDKEHTRKCDTIRRHGRPLHRELEVEHATHWRDWVHCAACMHEYDVYCHARHNNIDYPVPDPPFY
ncbi:hypothetical protein FMUND_12675 [Fusarium mundagurra]|uniref:Uncharacterized protein n=1 Tax=Fusarium mundagurra TaxID=1567541 RepID=A0A8H5Y1K6_9HYPO|nr:hypothetical protein FMUND_12675 [Fusarium mundagurra]